MSCRLTALSAFFLLFLLRAQTFDLTHAPPPSSLSDFDLPEIDGSAVEDTCAIFSTIESENTPPPITPPPANPTPPRTPPTKDTATPIRPKPAPPGPITHSQSDLAARLLTYLLANSRGHGAHSWNNYLSKPRAGVPHHHYGMTSDSDESAPTWLRNTNSNRWRKGLFPLDDSSDES
ncbi:hypothetical protein Q5P01_002825 [Channa striata]|uniref:Uncharacterized protein n=1 Tax=Channa striata TaxID=64152 RepID=A0AA88NR56_CHASR|nr:hypothetical protein Q5P01_002825 [Channa striata]